MPDLANLSAMALAPCPAALKPPASEEDLNLQPPRSTVGDGGGLRVFKRRKSRVNQQRPARKASGAKSLDDHVRDRIDRKQELGVPESRCVLPFLTGSKKLDKCYACHSFVYPGDELSCSVRSCQGVYHKMCVTEYLRVSSPATFKCPLHTCFLCKKKPQWLCTRCPTAWHHKCSPWPEKVIQLEDKTNNAVCWKHPSDWRLDGKNEASTSNIEEIFNRLPLPYVEEEFKIDITWKDSENVEPPPYVHIKRNVYIVKKKRDHADVDPGCTSCSTECCEDCMCRVQCFSCSKACHCSENCKNRPFRKEKKIKIVKTELCGWGVVASESIDKGDFIIEYIGEVIDDALCERRLWDMKHKEVHNFYMVEIRKDFTIDATYKGNPSRFLNHSCDPNCFLEKWQVDGETRVGVFAARLIEVGEPLTYDYRFVQFGAEVACQCGASNCQGFLGVKKKVDKIGALGRKQLKLWGSKRKRSTSVPVMPLHSRNPVLAV